MNEEESEWEDIVLHAQIEEEIAIMGAASIKNQHGLAGIGRSLRPLLDLGDENLEKVSIQKSTVRVQMI
jgi:hypothetical protein